MKKILKKTFISLKIVKIFAFLGGKHIETRKFRNAK